MDFATLGFSEMISLLILRLRFILRRLVLVLSSSSGKSYSSGSALTFTLLRFGLMNFT